MLCLNPIRSHNGGDGCRGSGSRWIRGCQWSKSSVLGGVSASSSGGIGIGGITRRLRRVSSTAPTSAGAK
jgi:hypothetical protein